ncbi:hypothetical protein Tco_0995247 [Tanacetum coccineum]
MFAPSGGGLILYQAYGNLYAMTGRKAHLLEDKQIPSVGVFDEGFLPLGWLLEEIHVTWAHLEKKQTRLRALHPNLEEVLLPTRGDGVENKATRSELYLPVNVGLFRKYEELQAKKKKRMKEFPLLNAKFQELNENAKACFELEKEVVVVS